MNEIKILAINGSPRARNSNTHRLLEPFLAGAEQAGAETEIIYAAELNIKDCLGCFHCWAKTPGCCIMKDDMSSVLEKMKNADITIWATPLYHFGMTARLKKIMERTLPLCKPYIVNRGGHYSHPPRYAHNAKNLLIANCGFPERHHFNALVEQFNLLSANVDNLIGSILCPAGEVLSHIDCTWYYDALRRAGQEVVVTGSICSETAAVLAKNIIPLEIFLQHANESWHVPGEIPPTLAEAMAGENKES